MKIQRWHVGMLILVAAFVSACVWLRPASAPSPTVVASPLPLPPTIGAVPVTRVGPPEIYPRIDLNPGLANPDITQDKIAETICNKDWKTSSIRPPSSYTTHLKIEQIAEHGFNDTNTGDYEEDHIISLENGGHPRDPKNLYPEAYDTQVNGQRVGPHENDQIENYVHNGICRDVPDAKFSTGPKPSHALTLEQGQQILATDWYKCYLHMRQHEDCVP
jgi:hypothetical protein